jgi:hypothetical protein
MAKGSKKGSRVEPVIANVFEGKTMLDASKARQLGGIGNGQGKWVFPDGSELHLIDCTWRALAPGTKRRRRS